MGTRCANHVAPLYPQKLALTSPTGGGRSVGMVRSRTKATEFYVCIYIYIYLRDFLLINYSNNNENFVTLRQGTLSAQKLNIHAVISH